ncbi:MAG TPA: glycoside hydrolase family 3 N-terminal domain-containing protein [Acidobacteriota bacterium]|nr:glycoside hydrolase family 3 N-terminal domain-containing protein [Acidobacteriota bacterium]
MSTAPSLRSPISQLLSRMSLREKIGQMTQVALESLAASRQRPGSAFSFDRRALRRAVGEYAVGSVLNVADQAFPASRWRQVIGEIQEVALKETRQGIPVLFGIDSVHGANYTLEGTIFPHNLGLAATWNPDLARRCATVAARQTLASGIPWTFAPVLDLGRQPLWSRFTETFGEDVLLARRMGGATVEGLQTSGKLAACAKHFVGYGVPATGKDRTPAYIPEHFLREYYLPPFEAAFQAGVDTVMVNSGEINGRPVHASKELLHDLLRVELGFQGVVVTDWMDVKRLHTIHRVASSLKEAVRLAVEAGIDMSMTPHSLEFCDLLQELVEEGRVAEERINRSADRILTLKGKLGLFDEPLAGNLDNLSAEGDRTTALEAARQAVVLLRNQGILPLQGSPRVLLTGPGSDSLPALHGPWSYTWQGLDEQAYPDGLQTLRAALQDFLGDRLVHRPGCGFQGQAQIEASVDALRQADLAVCCLAEEPSVEKPGDIEELSFPAVQLRLAEALLETGKPVVLIVLACRPRLFSEVAERAQAVLWAGYPGATGAQALSEILTGRSAPCGRLPFTYPRSSGSLLTYDHKNSEKEDIHLGMKAFNPLFQFGQGLTYTEFDYCDLRVGVDGLETSHQEVVELRPGQQVSLSLTVKNSGSREGCEVVQLYVRDLYASLTPPARRLKDFRRLSLEPGSSQEVTFALHKRDFSFVHADNIRRTEAGDFEVLVGPFIFNLRLLNS